MAQTKSAGQKPAAQTPPRNPQPPEPPPAAPDEAPIEIPDERDTVKRRPTTKHSGKVVKATPTHGGTVIEMRPEDWANVGIDGHALVRWDFLQNKFQVPVEQLSEEALAYLLEHDPNRFEVVEPTK